MLCSTDLLLNVLVLKNVLVSTRDIIWEDRKDLFEKNGTKVEFLAFSPMILGKKKVSEKNCKLSGICQKEKKKNFLGSRET